MLLYSRGRCLFWDATYVNTFNSSNVIRAALAAGSVANAAEVRKNVWHAVFDRRFIFKPVADKTSGTMGKFTLKNIFRFGSPIGREISGSTRERFPVPKSVFGYSQRERLQHFAVIPCRVLLNLLTLVNLCVNFHNIVYFKFSII